MPKRDPRVTQYIENRAPFARPILKHLRKVIHDGGPEIEEAIKWGMPSFVYQGKIVCGIAGFKAHCALWFWQGKTIVGKKPGEGMGNFGRITSVEDLPPAAKIKAYVKKATKRIDRERGAKPTARSAFS
jgi:hypothetical protein